MKKINDSANTKKNIIKQLEDLIKDDELDVNDLKLGIEIAINLLKQL